MRLESVVDTRGTSPAELSAILGHWGKPGKGKENVNDRSRALFPSLLDHSKLC
jgi:hypothetical protein